MSRGYQRDAAEQIACKASENYLGYSSCWARFSWLFDLHKSLVDFNKAISICANQLCQVSESAIKAAQRMFSHYV